MYLKTQVFYVYFTKFCLPLKRYEIIMSDSVKCTSKSIKVYQDGSLVLSAKTQIPEISYIGITASTSYWGYENHKVRNLKVSSNSLPKIRLDANGGKCPVSSMYIVSNGSTKLPSATRAGYTFLGWYTDRTGAGKLTHLPILSETGRRFMHAGGQISTQFLSRQMVVQSLLQRKR